MRVFVYGTLRKGGENHHFLVDSKYLGEEEISGFKMFNIHGFYPAAVPSIQNSTIKGEVYEIDGYTLQKLDHLEGCPHLYKRITVATTEGPAEIYVWNGLPDLLDNQIVSGDWFDVAKHKSAYRRSNLPELE